MQWKPWSTLHVLVVSRVHLSLGRRCFRSRYQSRSPFMRLVLLPAGISLTHIAAYTPESGKQSYRSHGTSGAKCRALSRLQGIPEVEAYPKTTRPLGRIAANSR